MERVPKVRPQADSVDRRASHSPGVTEVRFSLAVGGPGVPRPVQYPLGHWDCKMELGQFSQLVPIHDADPGSTWESEFKSKGEVQRRGFEVQ